MNGDLRLGRGLRDGIFWTQKVRAELLPAGFLFFFIVNEVF